MWPDPNTIPMPSMVQPNNHMSSNFADWVANTDLQPSTSKLFSFPSEQSKPGDFLLILQLLKLVFSE